MTPYPPHVALLYALPASPTDDQLTAAARELAHAAERKSDPRKAVGATLRTHRKAARLSNATVTKLTSSARAILDERTRASAVPPAALIEHVGVEAAATMLGESSRALHQRMESPVQRRLYGWPTWNGREFRFPLPALRAETRATFLDTLPAREPAAIAATLPAWCTRDGVGDRVSDFDRASEVRPC